MTLTSERCEICHANRWRRVQTTMPGPEVAICDGCGSVFSLSDVPPATGVCSSPPDETIRAGRLIIWKGGKFKRIRQLIFSLSRRYPLGGRLDQLIESPEAYLQHVAKLIEEASESDRQDRYFCPLDGVVKPIEIVSSSPAWTWDELCGREWTSEVCPHCLFGFSTRLTAMN